MEKKSDKPQERIIQLEKENIYLKSILQKHNISFEMVSIHPTDQDNDNDHETCDTKNNTLSPADKIAIYRSLFRGRNDVYPIRWESSKSKRTGYSPTCHNEWDKRFCRKPQIKCSDCPNQKWKSVTDQVIYDHLVGKHTVGVYPMLENDTCYFLAIDFDKDHWQKDVASFYYTCKKYEAPVLVERSQSGNGAHVWLFFSEAIYAGLARNLGTGLLTLTMQEYPHLSLESYDRLFPNQDTLPNGGFGNLIAPPLQGKKRQDGNSMFVDVENEFNVFPDPWEKLKNVEKLTLTQVELLLQKVREQTEILDIKTSATEEEFDKPWEASKTKQDYPTIQDVLPKEICITKANLLYIPLAHLPNKLINRIRKIATFQNPAFYKAQAMRLSVHEKPRIINCSELFEDYIGLPRGCETDLLKLLDHYKIQPQFDDQQEAGKRMKIAFQGKLSKEQKNAVSALLRYETGVFSAATGFGKTVIAAYIIGKRKVNTLILVHRQQLLEQWQERLSHFLNLKDKPGVIGGGKFKPTFRVDIAMMQSLIKEGNARNEITQYGQVIVDECHHLSAFSFEQILKKVKAKYVLGLTATPYRKDGHQPIIFMQCGPIRYQVSTKSTMTEHNYQCTVHTKTTSFTSIMEALSISELYHALSEDQQRNEIILNDIVHAYNTGRYPLVITSRKQHLDWFYTKLKAMGLENIFIFQGGMSKKSNATSMKELSESQSNRIILATGQYIGEGFDDPKLDTLLLALPISWHGTLQQYVGRLHRQHDNKQSIVVYDYIDVNSPVLMNMYRKRLKKYRAMGYVIQAQN